jgi:hypothetical protein
VMGIGELWGWGPFSIPSWIPGFPKTYGGPSDDLNHSRNTNSM